MIVTIVALPSQKLTYAKLKQLQAYCDGEPAPSPTEVLSEVLPARACFDECDSRLAHVPTSAYDVEVDLETMQHWTVTEVRDYFMEHKKKNEATKDEEAEDAESD